MVSEEPNVDVMSENLRHLVHEAAQLKAENARLRELIGRLAETYHNLDYRSDPDICYWCGEWTSNHKPDCHWLEARKVLEEAKNG